MVDDFILYFFKQKRRKTWIIFLIFFETAAAFLAGVTGVSILFGFGTTLAAAKKKDPHFFDRGLSGTFDDPQPATPSAPGASASGVRHGARRSMAAAESGASLALRALGWGTVYSVAGCSLLFYAIWKMMGVQNVNITWLSRTVAASLEYLLAGSQEDPADFLLGKCDNWWIRALWNGTDWKTMAVEAQTAWILTLDLSTIRKCPRHDTCKYLLPFSVIYLVAGARVSTIR